MSTDPDDTDFDDPALPAVADIISTGAAADSAESDERLKVLPRILRYAVLAGEERGLIMQRLVAEIDELCPRLPLNAEWARQRDVGVALAHELDHRAVVEDTPNLRSLADCVRLLSLPTPRDNTYIEDHRRVAKALLQALDRPPAGADTALLADLEAFCFGWAALPACTDLLHRWDSAAASAMQIGRKMAKRRIAVAEEAAWQQVEEADKRQRSTDQAKTDQPDKQDPASIATVPDNHVVVAHIDEAQLTNSKLRDLIGPTKHVINTALPLILVRPLHQVRELLMFEFPYALEVIDFALADLVGRTTVKLRPLLLVGDPGGGKSRFARRLGEALELTVWRTDASRSDGAVFAGTDKRWHSAEPCHPFLAIAQAKQANPLVLIDEIEKAGTRSDYGRFWDCLLGFLEPETNTRYPDPALQTTLDLSHISYVATANSLDPLPSPIRDRFRVVSFPKPNAHDLDALLPAVIADLAKERGLHQDWVPPLDGVERAAVAQHWRGGSVRRLRRVVEAVLRTRDTSASRN
jgi:ATP-dependent Lon protease